MSKKKNISFSYQEYSNPEELSPDDIELITAAKEVAINAYAPYSRFRVGAAIRLDNGVIIRGANVENAAFPSGICAERNAIANAAVNYSKNKPLAIALAAMTEEGYTKEPPSPCGNCRQVIAEEESRNGNKMKIILSGINKIIVIDDIGCLLPLHFDKTFIPLKLL